MFRAIAFGCAVGAGVQAWRAIPPDGPVSSAPAAVLLVVAVGCAYLGGLWRSRGRGHVSATATAVAVAEAVASNTVNVAVLVPGAATGAASQAYELERAPWFGGQRAAITADDLDGIDLSDVLDTMEQDERELA